MSDTPERHGPEHRLERLIFFSDAVFAIAITLLVIELRPPHVEHVESTIAFINATLMLIPNFVGFTISFFVIGAFWMGHHRAFACAAHWSDRLMPANIQLLFAIAAMPFFTAYLSEYSVHRVPVVLYCGWLLITALLNVRVGRLATSAPVVDPHASPEALKLVRDRGRAAVLGALTSLLVALFAPYPVIAQISLSTIPLWRRALTRWARKKSA